MEPNDPTTARHAISVRVELAITTYPTDDAQEGEREMVMWAESTLDPTVGFPEALERASARLVTAMAVESVLGIRLRNAIAAKPDTEPEP